MKPEERQLESEHNRAALLKLLQQKMPPQPKNTAVNSSSPAPRSPLPSGHAALIHHFQKQAQSLSATVVEVRGVDSAIKEIERYMACECPSATKIVLTPSLSHWPWAQSTVMSSSALAFRAAREDDEIGISDVYCAIADTGTLMLISGEQTPSTVSLLPETHIAIVLAKNIVPYMEDAWQKWAQDNANQEWPRAVNFVSGPSRTGDIEQTIVLGAHGPMRVHVIVLHDDYLPT